MDIESQPGCFHRDDLSVWQNQSPSFTLLSAFHLTLKYTDWKWTWVSGFTEWLIQIWNKVAVYEPDWRDPFWRRKYGETACKSEGLKDVSSENSSVSLAHICSINSPADNNLTTRRVDQGKTMFSIHQSGTVKCIKPLCTCSFFFFKIEGGN